MHIIKIKILFLVIREKIVTFAANQKSTTMKYPIGIQDFEKIIQNGYVYVDKTDLIYPSFVTVCTINPLVR